MSPTLVWDSPNGTLSLNGLCFSDEQDVVLLPDEINENGVIAAVASAGTLLVNGITVGKGLAPSAGKRMCMNRGLFTNPLGNKCIFVE